MNFTKDNSGFICHRCLYICFGKSDMVKHSNKKNICKNNSNCLLNDMEYKDLSLNNRYYFSNDNININFLTLQELTYIVSNHNNNFINILNEKLEKELNIEQYNKNQNTTGDNQIIPDKDTNYIIYENNIRKFKCPHCNTKYIRKDSLYKHLVNNKNCIYKQNLNKLFLDEL